MSEAGAAEPPSSGWWDRRRDLAGYVLTPLCTLVAAPVVACCAGLLASDGGPYPSVCEPVRAVDGCEERVLGVAAGYILSFVALWLVLWLLPWWRGLRVVRILLAVVALAVAVALALRLV
ncbi:hypothetical protein [Micromonospora sp. WMMD1082]|uniref:hypothetical protein n=1 Tax=Micromonospora sp. WMMD1082 TaxID=3016104 RepID=UPI00241720E3|nr:hypothetical protein [Micromonospora sp. WMMD1082]MDG4794445.1 hypothetical protein [Micromonospora sp. WMMD1082]